MLERRSRAEGHRFRSGAGAQEPSAEITLFDTIGVGSEDVALGSVQRSRGRRLRTAGHDAAALGLKFAARGFATRQAAVSVVSGRSAERAGGRTLLRCRRQRLMSPAMKCVRTLTPRRIGIAKADHNNRGPGSREGRPRYLA